jgi:hypothetical protein
MILRWAHQPRAASGRSVRRLTLRSAVLMAVGVVICPSLRASFDDFAQLDGLVAFDLPRRADTRSRAAITLRDLEALPPVLRGERAALVLAQTDQGNLAKLLVSGGFRRRKPEENASELIPVLILERFETLNGGDRRSFTARGKDVALFDGFQFDLDAGQVVPEGMGGDLAFSARAAEGPSLTGLGKNRLFTIEKPLSLSAPSAGKPSSGRAVLPGDFAGRFLLVANGQWSGSLDLAVEAAGDVTGHFRSDLNGSVYAVSGKVAAEVPQRIDFTIQFPRAKQSYQGLLWTEGKNVFAGTMTMLEHPYSFVAIREGAKLAPEGAALEQKPVPSGKSN